MTEVNCYHDQPDRLTQAVRLAALAWERRKPITFFIPDPARAEAFDKALWVNDPLSFIPHCHSNSAEADRTLIIITDNLDAVQQDELLVNLADEGGTRYLQAEVQVMTRKPAVLENVKTHTPAIRNALLMLFAQKTQADLRNKEGREQLQAAALEEVNRVLKEETGKGGVEAIFFMSFVTQ